MSIHLSLFFRPYQIPKGTPLKVCLDVAKVADEVGLYSITFGEHLLLGNNLEAYPYGSFLHQAETCWPEPLTTLAAMGAVTKKLLLSTGVLLAPLRPPLLLAKAIATLDVMTSGRVQLALGVGWQQEEYAAIGVPWEERYQRFDESVSACRAVWGEQPVNFQSDNVHLSDAWVLPQPLQNRIPLLYGLGMTPQNTLRMARYSDGWCPVGIEPAEVRQGVNSLADACAAIGRDMSTLHIKIGLPMVLGKDGKVDIPRSMEPIPDYLSAGATIVTVSCPPNPQNMNEIYQFIEAVALYKDAYS